MIILDRLGSCIVRFRVIRSRASRLVALDLLKSFLELLLVLVVNGLAVLAIIAILGVARVRLLLDGRDGVTRHQPIGHTYRLS